MRRKLDLDLKTLDAGFSMLIIGAYGCGKTHLQGDFLQWARTQGPARFIDVMGERGSMSLADMGLSAAGVEGETIETLADYEAALVDCQKAQTFGLAIDSAPLFYELLLRHYVGSVRYPDPKLDGERAKMLWGQIAITQKNAIVQSCHAAKYVLWVSARDRSQDDYGVTLTGADLPGKLSWAIAGRFDFVGELVSEKVGVTEVRRRVSFAPTPAGIFRQRLPKQITTPITIPDGPGGWQAIYKTLQAALRPAEKAA